MELHKKKCVPCRGDIPPFTKEQIDEYLKYLTDWKVQINEKKAFYLSRVYKFSDRKSTRLNSSHMSESRMPSSA